MSTGASLARRRTALTNPRARFGATATVSLTAAWRRDVGEHELVRAEPQHVADVRLDVARDEPVDDVVARSSHPRRAVDELGRRSAGRDRRDRSRRGSPGRTRFAYAPPLSMRSRARSATARRRRRRGSRRRAGRPCATGRRSPTRWPPSALALGLHLDELDVAVARARHDVAPGRGGTAVRHTFSRRPSCGRPRAADAHEPVDARSPDRDQSISQLGRIDLVGVRRLALLRHAARRARAAGCRRAARCRSRPAVPAARPRVSSGPMSTHRAVVDPAGVEALLDRPSGRPRSPHRRRGSPARPAPRRANEAAARSAG